VEDDRIDVIRAMWLLWPVMIAATTAVDRLLLAAVLPPPSR
jgi:hypothetical protein